MHPGLRRCPASSPAARCIPPFRPIVSVDDTRPIGEALAGVTTSSQHDTPSPTIGADDHATILFTSGSTGQSKGALRIIARWCRERSVFCHRH